MTSEILALVHNLYGASGGVVPGPAWTATLATLLWVAAYHHGLTAGRHVAGHGGDAGLIEEAFKKELAESLGWSEAQLEEFWNNPRYDFGPDDARRFDETYDAWESMVRTRRSP
ncbi:MAG: hypothetical protein WD690_08880 [Vicinamibacterales bacterium]